MGILDLSGLLSRFLYCIWSGIWLDTPYSAVHLFVARLSSSCVRTLIILNLGVWFCGIVSTSFLICLMRKPARAILFEL